MSAEVLRRAASLMRERAEPIKDWYSAKAWATTTPFGAPIDPADAEHIASWHPAVALAVADWLDNISEAWRFSRRAPASSVKALAVARAYLGQEDAS